MVEPGPIPGLHLGRVPAALAEAAAREAAGVESSWLQGQLGENTVYHLNLPFPIGFPTAPVFQLGDAHLSAVEAVARATLSLFGLDRRQPYAGLEAMHGIVRIYSSRECSLIGWHKDKRYFEDCVAGVVLENTLPGGAGLRFRPDDAHAHQGAEFGLTEAAGTCFLFEGDARRGWEHGFAMPQQGQPQLAGPHTPSHRNDNYYRRVTLTMRFYRLAEPKVAAKVARWRAEGMQGKMCVQFVAARRSCKAADVSEGWRAAEVELAKYVVPADWSLAQLRRLAAAKLGLEAVAGFRWRGGPAVPHDEAASEEEQQPEGGGAQDEAAWERLKAAYLATQAMRPVLRLAPEVGGRLNSLDASAEDEIQLGVSVAKV